MLKPLEKLLERLTLLFPRTRVHFIYTHRNGHDRFVNGLKANTEISYFCFKALQSRFPHVQFLRLEKEKNYRINAIGSQDVVIGHIGETFLKASSRTKRLVAFYPWSGHEDRSTQLLFNCLPLQEELMYWERSASVILLTSEFNKRKYIENGENFWAPIFKDYGSKKRIVCVHQPIDLDLFKRIKWEYTTSDFVYIGNDAHMKCLETSKGLVKHLGRNLHLFGVDGKKIDHRNEKEVTGLCHLADFFIQPGMWEAQCVSILESAARGFIPVVSKETGYPYDHPFLLRYNDFEYNSKVLNELLHTSNEERKVLADHLHKSLVEDENHNNWKKLTDVLVKTVSDLF